MPYSETVKGFEVSSGSYVTLSKEEIAAADGPGARMIEIEHFAGREEIDPVYYDRAYRLGPGKFGDRVLPPPACGARALRPGRDRSLRLSQQGPPGRAARDRRCDRAAHDALRRRARSRPATWTSPPRSASPQSPRSPPPARSSSSSARAFSRDTYEDTYRDALLKLIERKAQGETITAPEAEQITPADDLLGALQASLEQRGARRAQRKAVEDKGEAEVGTVKTSQSSPPGARADGQAAVERLAQLRACQRAGDALQRRARSRHPLSTAARAGLLADRDPPGLRAGGEAGAMGGDRPGLRARRTVAGCSSPTRTSRRPPPDRAARSTSSASSRLEEIDPVYFDRSYLLVPADEGAARAYALLSETMQDSGKAALGRFVLRAKERLVAIRVRDGRAHADDDARSATKCAPPRRSPKRSTPPSRRASRSSPPSR